MKKIVVFILLLSITTVLGSGFETKTVTALKLKKLSAEEQLTTPPAKELAMKFMDHLIQSVDDQYRVENYQSKEEYIASFLDIASKEVTERYVDFYYYDMGGALYVVPTETPPWLEENNTFTLTEISRGHYKLVQINDTELYGKYTIEIDYKYKNGRWHIEDVTYN
jgi:hypothetical protein